MTFLADFKRKSAERSDLHGWSVPEKPFDLNKKKEWRAAASTSGDRPKKLRLFMTDSVAVICEGAWFTGTNKHGLGFLWRDEAGEIIWLQENGCRRGNLV